MSSRNIGEGSVLDQAIAKIGDDVLRERIVREVKLLRGSRRFGLVFDRHLPELVRLPSHPVRKGVQVGLRDESSRETWRVARFADNTRTTAILDDGTEIDTAELVVVREFGEPVYPGLRSVQRIANGSLHEIWHTVINGENYHVLQVLRTTHRGKIDLIYIDPPYNTGKEDWIYNDRYVDSGDRARSSKWLSFLERRLDIAKTLLKSTGVIIVAIGDDEQHRLRMLMDQVFGVENFISNVVWQGGRKNDSQYVSNGADYMLIYARNKQMLAAYGVRWRERRKAYEEMLAAGRQCWEESEHDPEVATALMKGWIRALPDGHEAKQNNRFYEFDPDTGRVFRKKDISWPGGGGPRYDVLHPVTGLPVRVPSRGWVYSDPATMQAEIAAGRVLFGPDHTHYINRKLYLDEAETMTADSVFFQKRTSAGKRLKSLLGDNRFPYPKDHEVLMRWIRLAAPKNAVILDFFGGSGTTSEAVMCLNAEDGGTRQSIMVTNNEVGSKRAATLRRAGYYPGDPEWEARGVFWYVAWPRITTVVTGTRLDGSTFSSPVAANVEFFDLHYLDPGMVRRGKEFAVIAPLLWLEAGAIGERIDTVPECGWALADNYGVLFDIDTLKSFAEAVTKWAKEGRTLELVFVVTDSLTEFQLAGERLPTGITTVQLFEDYLTNFTINIERSAR